MLVLQENVNAVLVQRVVTGGYAPDLTDDEVEKIGRDPFLIAYALRRSLARDGLLPRKSRGRPHNDRTGKCRMYAGLWRFECCGPFTLNRNLGFRTGWRA